MVFRDQGKPLWLIGCHYRIIHFSSFNATLALRTANRDHPFPVFLRIVLWEHKGWKPKATYSKSWWNLFRTDPGGREGRNQHPEKERPKHSLIRTTGRASRSAGCWKRYADPHAPSFRCPGVLFLDKLIEFLGENPTAKELILSQSNAFKENETKYWPLFSTRPSETGKMGSRCAVAIPSKVHDSWQTR